MAGDSANDCQRLILTPRMGRAAEVAVAAEALLAYAAGWPFSFLDAARRAAAGSVDRRLDRQRLRVARQCNDDRGSRPVGVTAIEPKDSSDKQVTA